MVSMVVFNVLLGLADLLVLGMLASPERRKPRRVVVLLLGLGVFAAASILAAFPVAGRFPTIRLMSQAIFVHAPIVLAVVGIVVFTRSKATALACWTIGLVLIGVGIDAFFIEPRWLYVRRVRIESSRIERPLRLVLLADIQTHRITDYERGALERAMAEKPDLILFGGDYLQSPHGGFEVQSAAFVRMLRETSVKAPLGAYAVQGNIDRAPRWLSLFEGTPVRAAARTRIVEVGGIELVLLSEADSADTDLRLPTARRFRVVLGHRPDYMLGDTDAGLALAGHTHGGQVQLPLVGPLMTLSAAPRAWASGHTVLDDGRHLIVSNGIGLEGGGAPRLRFLCRPEIVVIDLTPPSS